MGNNSKRMESNTTKEKEVVKPTKEDIERVENSFKTLCRNHYITYGSKKYMELEKFYFSGAIMAFNYSVPSWGVSLMSGRPILEKFK